MKASVISSAVRARCWALLWLLTLAPAAFAAEPAWLGKWVLNAERSAEVQPEQPLSKGWLPGGNVSTTISVGGLPLPGTGGGVPSAAPDTAPSDPGVLRTKALLLSLPSADVLRLEYKKVGEESLRRGTHRGIKTSWRSSTISTSYRTTERRVAQSYELQPDDSLLVTTTIKRKKSKKRTYKQIFERPDPNGKDSGGKESSSSEEQAAGSAG